jgi:GrpB-like predicted nucleotidyltransferase (UPF0157 family)
MPLPPPSNEVVEFVRASTGVNENRIKEAVKILKDWLKLQPHLPHDYGKLYTDTDRQHLSSVSAKLSMVHALIWAG